MITSGRFLIYALLLLVARPSIHAQTENSDLGLWYAASISQIFRDSSWGYQADAQFRTYDGFEDFEQFSIRGGVNYKCKKSKIKFTIGHGLFISGSVGPSFTRSNENRFNQDMVIPLRIFSRIYTSTRLRMEQRIIPNSKLRTRYRLKFEINVPINKKKMEKNALYLSYNNELLMNGQRNIGNGKTVNLYDRLRTYAGLGFVFSKSFRFQAGFLNQSYIDSSKSQILFTLMYSIK